MNTLSEDEISRYHSQGYCISPVIFNDDEVNVIRQAFERLYANDLDDGREWPYVPPVIGEADHGIRTALFAAYVNRDIRRAVAHPTLVEMAASLLATPHVRLWQDQAIWKPGKPGNPTDVGNIGYHQDFAYWQDSSTTNMVSANIALQDVTIKNGALRLFPGSHQQGLIGGAYGDFFNTDIETLKRRFREEYDLADEIVIELKAGQVSFHHSLTVHGSGANTSSSARLVLAPAYMPADTFYREEGQPPCPHSEFLGTKRSHGMPFAGEHFPQLC